MMKVKELINILRECDGNKEISFECVEYCTINNPSTYSLSFHEVFDELEDDKVRFIVEH